MTYAKIYSPYHISTVLPKSGRDDEGRLVTGGLENRPDILKKLGFLPVEETEMPSEVIEGHHYIKKYSNPDNEKIYQTWESVEDPPPPPAPTKVYSKLKILMAAQQADPPFIETVIGFLESSPTIKYIWDASNTIEDNELLGQYLPDVAQALGKTVDEVKAFLDSNCVAD